MPRQSSKTHFTQKLGTIGNVVLLVLVLSLLAILSFAWPAFWSELVREESLIIGVAGDLFDLRQLLGISIAITFVIALLRKGDSDPRDLVFHAAGVLAGVAIAGGGWAAPLGLAGIAVAVLVCGGAVDTAEDDVD